MVIFLLPKVEETEEEMEVELNDEEPAFLAGQTQFSRCVLWVFLFCRGVVGCLRVCLCMGGGGLFVCLFWAWVVVGGLDLD